MGLNLYYGCIIKKWVKHENETQGVCADCPYYNPLYGAGCVYMVWSKTVRGVKWKISYYSKRLKNIPRIVYKGYI